jgi:hypothetical protein
MKWHKKTIDFFVDMEEANGWSHTSYRILQYLLADQIDYNMNNKIPLEDLFKDLTEQVENKINKQINK